MTVRMHEQHWTETELIAMPKDGYEREVVKGELVVVPAGFEHGIVITRIAGQLSMYVDSEELGAVLGSQTGCRMKSGDVFSPDVSFVTNREIVEQKKHGKAFFQALQIWWLRCCLGAIAQA